MSSVNRMRVFKWLVILVCTVVVLAAGLGTRSLSVNKRGIVIGIGLDRTEDGYLVSAQMMQPGSDSAPSSPVMYEVVVGEGPTVHEAMSAITKKSSLYPSYVHCKVLFLGESMLPSLDDVLIRLMQSNELGNVQVVAVEGSAYQVITATVAILPTTSAYIERDNMLVSKFGGRRLVSLKDYCQRTDGKSGNKFLPYAVPVKAEKPTGGDQPAPAEEPVLYDLLNTVAYDRDDRPHVYGHAVTEGVGLVEAKGGQFTAYREDGRFVTVRIDGTRIRRRYQGNTVDGRYAYQVSILEQNLSERTPEADEVNQLVAQRMDEAMEYAYRTCLADGVDIFSVAGHLYKRYGREVSYEDMQWHHTVEVKCK